MCRRHLLLLMCSVLGVVGCRGAAAAEFGADAAHVYRTVDDVSLQLFVFQPTDHQPSDKRPAIVFFFGGGWRSGSPKQFAPHCRYLADRGMVAIAADYRVSSRHGTKVVDCVADAKEAVRWVRQQAGTLGIDPQRVAAGGGSAGGHLAACTAVVKGFEDPDSSVSSVPDALVLFNPALALAAVEGQPPLPADRTEDLPERVGADPRTVSPLHHVSKGAPPTIIFHGEADTTVPIWTAKRFAEAMEKAGNRCELVSYPDRTHGFFNAGRGDQADYQQTLQQMDAFLVSLGFLTAN